MLGDEIASYLTTINFTDPTGNPFQLIFQNTSLTQPAHSIYAVPFPPEAAETAVAVIEYGGDASVWAFGASLTAPVFEHPRFQICVRDRLENAQAARKLIQDIHVQGLRKFAGNLSGAFGSTMYAYVDGLGAPFFLKYDESNRVYYCHNYAAYKTVSPG